MKILHLIDDHTQFLFRQAQKSCVRDNRLTGEAFEPSKKQGYLLSVHLASMVSPEESYSRAQARGLKAVGVLAVTVGEFASEGRPVRYAPEHPSDGDGTTFEDDAHSIVDFTQMSHGARTAAGKHLRDIAKARGYLHPKGAGTDHEVADCTEHPPAPTGKIPSQPIPTVQDGSIAAPSEG